MIKSQPTLILLARLADGDTFESGAEAFHTLSPK